MRSAGRDEELYRGLVELSAGAFPKRCASCGHVYANFVQFLEQTTGVGQRSGLKSVVDDDGAIIVELFRNCSCGSTLMDFCRSRRDGSKAGGEHRERFGRMLELLVQRGIDPDLARAELLKTMRGEHSALIAGIVRELRHGE